MEFYTVGIGRYDEESFFGLLKRLEVDTFCDIRMHRGSHARTPGLHYTNARPLQEHLERRGIAYRHMLRLSPTPAEAQVQAAADKSRGETRATRTKLDDGFAGAFGSRLRLRGDVEWLLDELAAGGSRRVALFCSERSAATSPCAVVARALRDRGYSVTDL